MFEEYGNFNAKMIILVFNSHDAVGAISSFPVAGASKGFPDKQYPLVWIELFDRYILPRVQVMKVDSSESTNETNTSSGREHSEGWPYFYELSRDLDIPLVIYLHAEKKEVEIGEYNANGRWVIEFAKENDIPLITDIDIIENKDYRDGIHLSEEGQHVIFDLLDPVIEKKLSSR